MKNLLVGIILCMNSLIVVGQEPTLQTLSFSVIGTVEEPIVISYSDILEKSADTIPRFAVTNHLGEFRKEYKNVIAVSLLEILEQVKIKEPSPKLLSEYYFVFKASDGYSVVVSWNELFNTEIGKAFYIVKEIDGKSMQHSSDGILMICTKDFKTGRRHIKGLQSIEVKRI